MDSRLSKYSTAPNSYRSYLAQQGQQELDALEAQRPKINEADIVNPQLAQPQQAPPAQLTQSIPEVQSASQTVPQFGPPAMTGPLPQNAASALGQVGSQEYNELCQKFVEDNTYGHSGVYGSAINAWNAQSDKAQPGLDGITPGDLVYFGADQSNNNDGHTGIYTGNGNFVSATDNGVKQVGLGDWVRSTGQHILGYIPQSRAGDPSSHGAQGKGGGEPIRDANGRPVSTLVKTGLSDLLANKGHAVNSIIRYETQLGDMAPAQGAQQMDTQLYPDLLRNWQLAYGASKKAPSSMGTLAEEVKDALRAAIHQP